MSDSTIYVWSDNSWCYENELDEATTWKSDDYFELKVKDDETPEEVINNHIKNFELNLDVIFTKNPPCPKCDETHDVSHIHVSEDVAPAYTETDYFLCRVCGYQWGHE